MSTTAPWVRACLVAAACTVAVTGASGGDPGPSVSAQEQAINGRRRRAIERGCAWIVASERQGPDGSIGESKAKVAITALSALALMAGGSGCGPRRGPQGAAVVKAVDWLVKRVEQPMHTGLNYPDGYFHAEADTTSKMHGQGYATLALASALGSADDEPVGTAKEGLSRRIRAVLGRAVRCCEDAQTNTGGWGYDPYPTTEHEGSVTVTVAQGLRAARDAGIRVDDNKIRRGINYLERSQRSSPGEDDGSFRYSLVADRTSYALTAAALSSFFLFGVYEDGKDPQKRIERAIRYLQRTLDKQIRRPDWWYYGSFYAAWAAWQKDGDEPDGDGFWGPWHRDVYALYLQQQKSDGSWADEHDRFSFGPLLPTAFAVLTLAIPDEQLPIFQR